LKSSGSRFIFPKLDSLDKFWRMNMLLGSIDTTRHGLRSFAARAAGFFALWLILCGIEPSDLLVGILASVAATWASLRLLPPERWRLRPIALMRLLLRFPLQSIAAGIQTARCALDPRLPLRPGLVIYQSRLPSGSAQNTFFTLTSLLPGTLPCGTDATGGLVIHCLNVDQQVVKLLSREESLLQEVIGRARE
jgi:multicomponent Na+:H+ antiporter subunit E